MTDPAPETALAIRLTQLRDHPENKTGVLVGLRGVEHGDDARFARSLLHYLESWAAPLPAEAFAAPGRRLLVLTDDAAGAALARGAASLARMLRQHGFGEAVIGVYDLKTDAGRLMDDLLPRHAPALPTGQTAAPSGPGPALGKLLDVERALDGANIEPLLREETVWSFADPAAPQPAFTELAISLDELESRLDAPLRRDDWLRHEATEILDRGLLRHIARDRARCERPFAFDLHIATVLAPGFYDLAHAIPLELRRLLTVELASWEAGLSPPRFAAAVNRLADLGFAAALDRAPLAGLAALEIGGADIAYVKAAWPADGAVDAAAATELLRAGAARFGAARLVLWRCASPAALAAGQAAGLTLFQGRAADQAAAAVVAGRLEQDEERPRRMDEGEESDEDNDAGSAAEARPGLLARLFGRG